MRVRITVDAWVEIPDDTDVTAFAMTLQDSPAVLDAYLDMQGYDVSVYSPNRYPTDLMENK